MLWPAKTKVSRRLLLAGALVTAALAGWMTYAGLGYALGDCSCDGDVLPRGTGWLLLAFAAPAWGAVALLIVRTLRRP
jgi:hypothetical protein